MTEWRRARLEGTPDRGLLAGYDREKAEAEYGMLGDISRPVAHAAIAVLLLTQPPPQ